MRLPCEICVRRLVPLIKRELVIELYEEYKISQVEIAKILNITRGSVTQYLKGVRAKNSYKVRKSKKSSKLITKLANDISKKKLSPKEFVKRFCEICRVNQEVFCPHPSPKYS
ncbi:MAG: winged helix-turn-helix transcriptional regulator [Nanoarchaeota archaeon]|nr:winged helix-turn-helix transcriptional regulator [Nanoarchaeota archaeon]